MSLKNILSHFKSQASAKGLSEESYYLSATSVELAEILDYAEAQNDSEAVATIEEYISTKDQLSPVSRLYYVDKTRTDTYTEDGSAMKPFKTIAAALAKAKANGDGASIPYSFILNTGTYAENIQLNDLGLFSISLTGLGRVAIEPASGDALSSNSDNTDLQDLVITNIEFAKPVTLVGSNTANNFKTTIFRNCSLADAFSASFLNNFAFWDIYAASTVSFINTNYLYIGGGQILDTFSMQMDSNLTVPANGSTGGANIFGLICNAVSLAVGGAGVWNLSLHNTRAGLTAGNYTIPTGCNVALYNSILRGTWTNNGSLALRNSHTDNAIGGTAPLITSNRSEQLSYSPTTAADWLTQPAQVKQALDLLASGNYRVGTTLQRPTGKSAGFMYFDTDLGKPIWANGVGGWVDSTGIIV